MKYIIDKELKIIITNQIVNYDKRMSCLLYYKASTTRYRKNGFMTYDETGRKIGIVFMADDKRTYRYGNAEIMFFNEFENEFGEWRVIKINKHYLPFAKLEKVLQSQNEFTCITDERIR